MLDHFDPGLGLWVAVGVAGAVAAFLIVAGLHYLAMPRLTALAGRPVEWKGRAI